MGIIYLPWVLVGAHWLKPRAVVDGAWQINSSIEERLDAEHWEVKTEEELRLGLFQGVLWRGGPRDLCSFE
jgi:hypothetical protein